MSQNNFFPKNPAAYKLRDSIIILIVFFSIHACNEPSDIGLEIQPPQDKINLFVSDTTSIISYTAGEDSVRTDETSLALLGSYVDPIFGKSEASIYVQAVLPSSNVDFGTNPLVDSIVLSLAYDGDYYGNINSSQTVTVFEVLSDMYKDSTYYSSDTFDISTVELANYTFTPMPEDSVVVGADTVEPHLRIALDNTLGQRFLDESGSANLTDNNAFITFFKGLYITTDNPGQAVDDGAIIYFNLLSTVSNITLYYNDSLSYEFEFNSNSARINHFNHDYTGTIVSGHLTGTASDTNLVYIQSISGVKTILKLPHLSNWNTLNNIAINKAEVLLKVEPGSNATYETPEKLLLVGLDSAGEYKFLIDQLIDPEGTYYGGSFDSNKETYTFNIGQHFQQMLNDKTGNYGLAILAAGSAVNARRVVLGGASNPVFGMTLRITYTKF